MNAPSLLFFFASAPAAGAPAGLVVEPAPLDHEALAAAAARAWYWPEAKDAIVGATTALRVRASAPAPDPVSAALALTQAAAPLALAWGALAVLWEPTGLLHDPAVLADQAADATREDLPLYAWIRFEGTKGDDGTLGMRTHGLRDLGGLEVEVEGSKKTGEHVLEVVTDLALFVLTSPTLPDDGETIEVTAGPIRVRRMLSLGGDGTPALRARV
jgi:hypothetical protein